jgi:lysozyme
MNRALLITAGVVATGAGLYLAGFFDQVDITSGLGLGSSDDEVPQGPSLVDQAANYLDPFSWDLTSFYSPLTSDPMQDANVQAFLQVIRYAEGTAGPGGYNQIFYTAAGPNSFTDMSDHPHVAKQFKDKAGKVLWTTAAGAYQFMAASQRPDGTWTKVDTWTGLKNKLGLPDFSPASQDRAAVELISQCGALADVKAGRFDAAINKCKSTWASLPGAGYNQPEKSLASLRNVFAQAGGTIASA